ncbi:hypothetical protein K439DRAFT_1616417 [Ramaria rubella]|nr:hypothetical protein K439DRAFT_1616417 [Ramaria rubella]
MSSQSTPQDYSIPPTLSENALSQLVQKHILELFPSNLMGINFLNSFGDTPMDFKRLAEGFQSVLNLNKENCHETIFTLFELLCDTELMMHLPPPPIIAKVLNCLFTTNYLLDVMLPDCHTDHCTGKVAQSSKTNEQYSEDPLNFIQIDPTDILESNSEDGVVSWWQQFQKTIKEIQQ